VEKLYPVGDPRALDLTASVVQHRSRNIDCENLGPAFCGGHDKRTRAGAVFDEHLAVRNAPVGSIPPIRFEV
jgi:hypothetical protein